MKKLLSLLLAVVMLLSVSAVAFAATPDLTLTIDKVDALTTDETVTLNMKVTGTTPANGVAIAQITYNTDAFELVSGIWTTVTGSPMKRDYSVLGTASVANLMYNPAASADGSVLTLTLSIKDGATPDDYPISCTFTASDLNGNLVTAINDGEVSLTKPVVHVSGVSLNKSTLELKAGNSETLVATVNPDNATNTAVTWVSDKTSVATVDKNGLVEAVGEGTAKITVTTVDGAKKATCVVTVTCAHAHIITVPEEPSTCKNAGWDAYKKCDDCNKLFNMNDEEISAIPYRNLGEHDYGTLIPAVTPNHDTKAVAAHYICSVCEKYFTEAKVETTLAALTGDEKHDDNVAWVSVDDTYHAQTCSCGKEIAKAKHVLTWITDEEATKDAPGSKHAECATCGYIGGPVAIPQLPSTNLHRPTVPTVPGNNDKVDIPDTGVESPIALWITLAFVSLAGITALVMSGKKSKHRV